MQGGGYMVCPAFNCIRVQNEDIAEYNGRARRHWLQAPPNVREVTRTFPGRFGCAALSWSCNSVTNMGHTLVSYNKASSAGRDQVSWLPGQSEKHCINMSPALMCCSGTTLSELIGWAHFFHGKFYWVVAFNCMWTTITV